jgi:hypothetical protein
MDLDSVSEAKCLIIKDIMIYIAHRGNTEGPKPEEENTPPYIQQAIDDGYDVEVDVWGSGMQLFLGHDEGTFEVPFSFLSDRMRYLWVHCKNAQALHLMRTYAPEIRYFWHQTDDYTLTSWHDIWCYPGKDPVGKHSIIVMPEMVIPFLDGGTPLEHLLSSDAGGVCSDYVKFLRYK